MKRLIQAPNLALASLWCDMLTQAGFDVSVQREFAAGIAGQIPPDQALPEIWVHADAELDAARALLAQLQRPAWREWVCRGCNERIDGPFDQCWQCGRTMPA